MVEHDNIPKHIAIIMDGNGRWAKERSLPRIAGHREGMKRVEEIVQKASEGGVKVITLFAFSTENWTRPRQEIDMLMRSLGVFLNRKIIQIHRNNIRLLVIGRQDELPRYLRDKLKEAIEKTKDNSGLTVVLALNYGARQEIVDAAKEFCGRVIRGEAEVAELTVESFGDYFYTAGLPDPDLLIRTSGEMRISNFLLWQISYAELYFPRKYWPDFKGDDLNRAIDEYQKRERRFGRVTT